MDFLHTRYEVPLDLGLPKLSSDNSAFDIRTDVRGNLEIVHGTTQIKLLALNFYSHNFILISPVCF